MPSGRQMRSRFLKKCLAGLYGVIVNTPQVDNAHSISAWKKGWDKAGKYLALACFILAAFIFAKYFNTASLKVFLEKNEALGFIVCLVAFVLLNITPVPSDPITLLVIAWKGPIAAIILSTVGDTLSGIVDYYIGISVGDVTDFEQKKAKLPFHLDRLPMNSPMFLILARFIPGYGSRFVGFAAGVYKVRMLTYLWTGLIANLVGSVILVSGGYGLIQLFLNLFH